MPWEKTPEKEIPDHRSTDPVKGFGRRKPEIHFIKISGDTNSTLVEREPIKLIREDITGLQDFTKTGVKEEGTLTTKGCLQTLGQPFQGFHIPYRGERR